MAESLKELLKSDLYRIYGNTSARNFVSQLVLGESFKVIFWYRICHVLLEKKSPFLGIAKMFLKHFSIKFGISLPKETIVGAGFYIGHFGGVVINHRARIGKNCNLSHGVTIGSSNRGEHSGIPEIGNRVYIGPGAKIIGGIKIGDGAAIGANAVVTKDVPENAVVAGVPAKVISHKGSEGYVNHLYD